MPTDSALAMGIFLGRCIGSADVEPLPQASTIRTDTEDIEENLIGTQLVGSIDKVRPRGCTQSVTFIPRDRRLSAFSSNPSATNHIRIAHNSL